MNLLSRPLTRKQIKAFVPDDRSIISVENLFADVGSTGDVLETAGFIVTTENSDLAGSRVLRGDDDVTVTDEGAGGDIVLGLSDTGVTPGPYGSASQTISLTVDEKGRLSLVAAYELNTDNIIEGIVNLFFTVARARAAISGTSGISYDLITGVITLDQAFVRGLLSGASGITYNSATGVFTLDQSFVRGLISGSSGITYNSGTGAITLDQSFVRGLFSGGSGINYNAGTGVIATAGYTGDIVVGVQTLHFVNGILDTVT